MIAELIFLLFLRKPGTLCNHLPWKVQVHATSENQVLSVHLMARILPYHLILHLTDKRFDKPPSSPQQGTIDAYACIVCIMLLTTGVRDHSWKLPCSFFPWKRNLFKLCLLFSTLCCSRWCQCIYSVIHLTLALETSDWRENDNVKIATDDKK